MLIKKFLILGIITFTASSCEMISTFKDLQNTESTVGNLVPCSSDNQCDKAEICDLSTNFCKADLSSFTNSLKASFLRSFKNVMFGYGYSFGYRDNTEHLFQEQDVNVYVDNLDLEEGKADFELSINPLVAGNVKKGASFMVNPLFVINITASSECINSEKILLKEIYTLSSEVFPIELISHQTHDSDFSGVYTPSLVFSQKNANLKNLCNEKNGLKPSRASFACVVVKDADTVKKLGSSSYGVINKKLNFNLNLETHGKNTIIKFNNDYSVCLEDLIKISEYKEERNPDNMAVFKIKGVYHK